MTFASGPRVLDHAFQQRMAILTNAERILRNELNIEVIGSRLAGPRPSLFVQYSPAHMAALTRRLVGRRNVFDDELQRHVASGEFEGCIVSWVLP